MNKTIHRMIRVIALFAMVRAVGTASFGQTATWSGGGGDGLWNSPANWDIGVPAEGTNAVIGALSVVTYDSPMAATSFAGLNNSGSLDVSAAGFNIDAAAQAAYTGNAASLLRVNASGVVVATNSGTISLTTGAELAVEGGVLIITNSSGNFTFGANGNNAGAGFTNISGTVWFSQPFQSRGRFSRFAMHGGSLTLLGGGGVFETSNDQERQFLINGGNASLGDFSISRTLNGVSQAGLVLSNGVVNVTSLRVGVANAAAGTTIAGGVLTNTGAFTICDRTNGATSGNRRVHFYVRGGSVYSTDAAGIIIANQGNSGSAAASVIGGNLDINSGLLVAEGITLVKDSTLTNAHATLTVAGTGEVYLGSVGLIGNVGVSGTSYTMTFNGGTLGAEDDFSIVGNGTLSGVFTVKAANLAGTPQNITHTGAWSGSGALTKTGGGVLRLTGNNTYSGATFVNAGTLALDGSGSISNSPIITIASGAALDVSTASGGYTLNSGRTLAGFGAVTGDVFVAPGGAVNPGSNTAAGTFTFANALTETGGAYNHFDLSSNPSGPDNDLLMVTGDLNISGVNTLEIVGGGAPGSAHPLIKYGGSFNGTLANCSISGATGSLSNDASGKVIYLVIASSIRNPTSIVWVGNATVNDWDTVNRTNWSNTGVLDYFVSGDQVRFDATGAAHPDVNLVGNNAPATTTVDAVGNYTFAGGGAISGTGSLTKTNSGTLTITATNSYTGPTILGGGVLEATTLAIAGSPSSLGAAPADPNNLVFHGGTLRYLGETVATDRPATLNAGAIVEVASNETSLTLNGALTGAGGLTKAGPGTLVLGVANTHAGGTVISGGRLQVNANAATGTGGLTNNASTLRVQGALVLDNVVDWSGNCGLEFNGVGGNNTALRGAWSGNGTVNVYFVSANASQTFTIGGAGAGGGHMWNFAGTVDFGTNSGFLRINNDNSTFNFGSSNATFNLGTGTGVLNQRNGSTTTYLGALIGGPGTRVAGRGNTGASGTTTYEIGGNNLSTTFEGEINNGSGTTAITKVGTGTLALTGTNLYSGSTLVQNGTLQVDGALTASPSVSVLGGTLAGRGTISGAVDVQVGGTLSVGDGIPGQMTINSTLTFASGSTNFVEINKSDSVIDNVTGLTGVSYGGTLVISMVQGTLANGDSFKLFDAPPGSYSGAFEAIIPETPGNGLRWDLSSLTVDGTLKVTLPGVRIASFGFDAGNLSASGSGGTPFAEYQVLTSTNVAAPLAEWETNATAQFDGSGSFSFTTPLDPAPPRRFFRLQFQSP